MTSLCGHSPRGTRGRLERALVPERRFARGSHSLIAHAPPSRATPNANGNVTVAPRADVGKIQCRTWRTTHFWTRSLFMVVVTTAAWGTVPVGSMVHVTVIPVLATSPIRPEMALRELRCAHV